MPDYPEAPAKWDEDGLRKFVSAQYNWAVGAIAAYSSVKVDRKVTADCLNKLRASGVIN